LAVGRDFAIFVPYMFLNPAKANTTSRNSQGWMHDRMGTQAALQFLRVIACSGADIPLFLRCYESPQRVKIFDYSTRYRTHISKTSESPSGAAKRRRRFASPPIARSSACARRDVKLVLRRRSAVRHRSSAGGHDAAAK